jgi:hypothetical protein
MAPNGQGNAGGPAGGQAKQKKKMQGWKAEVGGGYEHQFFDNAALDKLE